MRPQRCGALLLSVVMLVAGAQAVGSAAEAAAVPVPAAPRIALRYDDGGFAVKSGILSAKLQNIGENVTQIAVAGDRVGVVTTSKRLLVKEGELTAPWVEVATDAAQVELSGNRVGYINTAGVAFVKLPALDSDWVQQAENVKQLVLSGRRLAVVQKDGTALAKDGGLDVAWTKVTGGVNQVAISGDRFAVLDFGSSVSVKEGTLSAPWTRVGYDAKSVSLQAMRIGILKKDGTAQVKQGDLDADWVHVADNASQLALEGDRIGIVENGSASVKQGTLDASWVFQGSGVAWLEMAIQARAVTEFGAKCDGETDDTKAIQATITSAKPNDTVTFPEGQTCRYSKNLNIKNKKYLTLQGGGKDSTNLEATNDEKSSLQVHDSEFITLEDFQISSPTAKSRDTRNPATGIWIQDSKEVDVFRVSIQRSASAGIFIGKSRNVQVMYSDVRDTLADGIHISGGSSNVTLQYNNAVRTGDDSYATVSYQGTPQKNENIRILDNTSRKSNASGVTVEGSKGVRVERNSIYQSEVAGMRITISKSYYSRGVDGVTFFGNTITRSPDNNKTDHPAILLFINYDATIRRVEIDQNKINDPESRFAVRLLRNGEGVIEEIDVEGNTIVSDKFTGGDCVNISSGISQPVIKSNLLNSKPCLTKAEPKPKPKPKPKVKPKPKKKVKKKAEKKTKAKKKTTKKKGKKKKKRR